MNVSQLANYYVNLGAYSVNAASAANADSSSPSYAVTASSEDTVSISETGRTLTGLSSTLTEVRGLVELAAQDGTSDDLRAEISSKVTSLLDSIDKSIQNDDGSSLSSAIDLSSVESSRKALSTIDEGLATVDSKRQELGIASAGDQASTVSGYSSSRRISNLSEDEVASLVKSLSAQASGSNSQISILLSSVSGNNNSALSGLYSLL